MADTTIEWATKVWNPLRGCSRVSEGCRHCYAERMAARFSGAGQPYEGLVRQTDGGPRWTGEVRFIAEKLGEPLRWRGPERVFVNSMSDLFHEKVTDEQIAAVFGVMAACPQHTFLVLTKRAERMRQWFEWVRTAERGRWDGTVIHYAERMLGGAISPSIPGVPLPNVEIGVSVEDQPTADERIPHLLATPAARRIVSLEPMIGPVDLDDERDWLTPLHLLPVEGAIGDVPCAVSTTSAGVPRHPALDWVIVGGESGPGARPFDLAWIRSIVQQCRVTGVPCFVKQLGARPVDASGDLLLKSRKGADMSEWPLDLRVREFPEARS